MTSPELEPFTPDEEAALAVADLLFAELPAAPAAGGRERLLNALGSSAPTLGAAVANKPAAVSEVLGVRLLCTYCHNALAVVDTVYCAQCLAPHHNDCVLAHGSCAAPGCSETQVVRPQNVGELPRRRRRWRGAALVAALVGGVAAAAFVPEWQHAQPSSLEVDPLPAPEADPSPAMELTELGRAFAAEGEHVQAIDAFTRALRLTPNDPELYVQRGLSRVQLGRLSEAIEDFDQALRLDPQQALTYTHRGELKADLGRYDEALRDLSAGLELDPGLANAYVERAELLLIAEKPEDALRDLERALALEPDLADAYLNRGRVMFSLQRHEEGLNDLDRALELDPTRAEIWLNRARVHVSLMRYQPALADTNYALELDPTRPDAFELRGTILLRLGRYEAALHSYQSALRLDPTRGSLWIDHGQARALLEDYAGALADFDRALQLAPKDTRVHFFRGVALYELGSYEQATEALRRALALGLPEGTAKRARELIQKSTEAAKRQQDSRYAKLDFDLQAVDKAFMEGRGEDALRRLRDLRDQNDDLLTDADRDSIEERAVLITQVMSRWQRGKNLGIRAEALKPLEEVITLLEDSPRNFYRTAAQRQFDHIKVNLSKGVSNNLKKGLAALKGAFRDSYEGRANAEEAMDCFERVRRDPNSKRQDIIQIKNAVAEQERATRYLYNSEKNRKMNREDKFEDMLPRLQLLKTWLPPGQKQSQASELYKLIKERLRKINQFRKSPRPPR